MKDFKVGQRYLVSKESTLEAGNVIEITSVHNGCVDYKTVKPKGFHVLKDSFGTESIFSQCLELFEEKSDPIIIYSKGSEVIALDKSNGEKGIAKCCPTDTFDFRIGAKLAFERLLGEDKKEVREVKRKAKVGEWVKVLHTSYFGEINKTPYITQCVEIMRNGDKIARLKDVGKNNKEILGFCENEYVVLENYQPPKEEEKEPVFEKGKRYIFDKDTYIARNGFERFWSKACYGMEVKVESEILGYVGRYRIHPSWCIEITEETPKLYNGKVVCVSEDGLGFSKGKIYNVRNGEIKRDDNETFPMSSKIKSFEDLEEYFKGKSERNEEKRGWGNYYDPCTIKFIEVVE